MQVVLLCMFDSKQLADSLFKSAALCEYAASMAPSSICVTGSIQLAEQYPQLAELLNAFV